MKLFTFILLINLIALSCGQYSFFDDYVKNFIKNVFQNSNGRGANDNGRGVNNNNNGRGVNSNNNGRNPSRGNQQPDLKLNCECSVKGDDRIVNGREGEFVPYLVSLGYVFKKSSGDIKYSGFCGGTIINSNQILTAGHCLKDLSKSSMSNYLIRYGITDLNEKITRDNTIQWKDFVVNEKYLRNSDDNNNDIGIITLQKPIDFRNSRARPACLDFTKNYSQFLSLSGWGRTNTFGKHNQTENIQLPTKLMQLDMKEDLSKSTNYIISAVGRAKNSGTCSGDSGSPLSAVNPRKTSVVGLVSYGVSNKDGIFCLSNTGFVRLGAHSGFIQQNTRDVLCKA